MTLDKSFNGAGEGLILPTLRSKLQKGNTMELKTPLYDNHVALGAKMVPFAGYSMPVQYPSGVIAEHMAVRTACGLFDVSHMGEITCKGTDALKNLNHMLTNKFDNMSDGRARYSPMCNDQGGVIDDLIVYKKADNDYLIVVNASNRNKDFAWIADHVFGDCVVEDISDSVGQIALQGPKAEEILSKIVKEEEIPVKNYTAVFDADVQGYKCIVSRTGYTGEDGFELYCDAGDAAAIWDLLLATGKDEGLIPCGLGARDTLRMEAAMPLYGHEMDDTVTPLETGLGFAVKLDKEEFIGKEGMMGEPQRTRIGLKVTGRGIIREAQPVFKDGNQIGNTTSGTHCPFMGYPVAMALVQAGVVDVGDSVSVDVRGRMVEAEVVPLPFYKKGMPQPEKTK